MSVLLEILSVVLSVVFISEKILLYLSYKEEFKDFNDMGSVFRKGLFENRVKKLESKTPKLFKIHVILKECGCSCLFS